MDPSRTKTKWLFDQLCRNILCVKFGKMNELKYGIFLRLASNGLVMEDEMTLDGAIISASFDESLDTVSHLSIAVLSC